MLAFVGMLIGLVLGNLENFSSWMFAATAGTLRDFTSIFSIFQKKKGFFIIIVLTSGVYVFQNHPSPVKKKNEKFEIKMQDFSYILIFFTKKYIYYPLKSIFSPHFSE